MTKERLDELRFTGRPLTESETCELFYEIDRLRHGIHCLRDTLQWLHDLQNGPPLQKYRDEWEEIMNKAEGLLKEWGDV